MTTLPGAKVMLISAGANDPPIIPVGVILHVDGGNASSLYRWFSRKIKGLMVGLESHLFIPKIAKTEQYRHFEREADAQAAGNSWIGHDGRRYGFISVETQGKGTGKWNAHQLAEIKRTLLFTSRKYNFPLEMVKVAQPRGVGFGGVGYHRLFKAWNPNAHVCPGNERARQFLDEIVPWMAAQSRPKPADKPPAPTKPPAPAKPPTLWMRGPKQPTWTVRAQKLLTRNGYPVPATGVFGKQTRAAVRRFRRAHKIRPYSLGVIGPAVWRALQAK